MGRYSKRIVALLGCVIALALTLTACSPGGSSSGNGKPVTIRVGWMFPGADPLYIMQTHPELLAGNGKDYNVEWNQLNGSSESVQGMTAGTLDLGIAGSVSVLNGYEKGANISLLAEMSEEKPGWGASWYFTNKSITSVDQLRGKSVGVNAIGSGVDIIMRAYFKEHGLIADKDYTVVAVPFATMHDALARGDIAMGTFPAPFDAEARTNNDWHILFATSDVQSPFVQVLLGANANFVKNNQSATESFMKDFEAATTWLLDPKNRETAIKNVSTLTKIPESGLSYMLDPKKGSLYVPPKGDISVDALQANWDFLFAQGAVSKKYRVEDYLTDVSRR